jgi:hypothetical protein
MINNDEFENMWRKASLTYFKLISMHFSGVGKEIGDEIQSSQPICWPRFILGSS